MAWTFYDSEGRVLGASAPGADGESAYQSWLGLGNTGSVEDFLLSIVGPGLASGGSTAEVLVKASGNNYDTTWENLDLRYAPVTEHQLFAQTYTVAPGDEIQLQLPLAKVFGLLAVAATAPSRLRLFSSEAVLLQDQARETYEKPNLEAGGLICDVVLTEDLLSVDMSQIGSCVDPASRVIPALLRNDSEDSTVELAIVWWPIEFAYQAPVIVSNPELTGSPTEGSTILLTPAIWEGYPEPEQTVQWQSSSDNITWADITGEDGSTYQLASSDVGGYVRVQVTATNSRGTATDSTVAIGPIS